MPGFTGQSPALRSRSVGTSPSPVCPPGKSSAPRERTQDWSFPKLVPFLSVSRETNIIIYICCTRLNYDIEDCAVKYNNKYIYTCIFAYSVYVKFCFVMHVLVIAFG